MTAVLFVCMGNLCRSPMARALADHQRLPGVQFDAAGTHAGLRAERMDPRAAAALDRGGIAASSKTRSRRVTAKDFERFDLILAMDKNNLAALQDLCPPEHRAKLHLFMDMTDDRRGAEVPDPYYGGPEGFDRVFEFCLAGIEALSKRLSSGTSTVT